MSLNVKIYKKSNEMSADYYIAEGEKIEELIQSYFSIMDNLLMLGVKSGSTYQNLLSYINEAKNIKNQIAEITELLSRETREFYSMVEELDHLT